MAWRRSGDKPLSEPMMVSSLMHICVTRPQWVNSFHCCIFQVSLQWRHNERDNVSHHQPYDCLVNRLFGRISRKTLKLRVTGLCVGSSPETGEFPTQMASNAENASIWWLHHAHKLSPCIKQTFPVILCYQANNSVLSFYGRLSSTVDAPFLYLRVK